MTRLPLLLVLPVLLIAGLAAACQNSDDEERLAAQRLFRNYLLQSDRTAISDVRVQGMVDELPPSFPEHEQLDLLGSAFTDTETRRELIIGWQSDGEHADDLFSWYRSRLDTDPWRVTADPQRAGVDFITFRDADNPAFRGELRISQEGDRAIVVLIAVETLTVDDGGA
ncbi:MAG: hypothetical protein F4Y69_00435 [Chloroflexi bacterium]|nr:hypothetical protein [Chloroflexota bacterium]MYB22846.1 hypothetical protein [Chloroflexota bacterium]MYF23584.1 hypothetical protein [Chloroflexota bacterium]MYF80439.1 hypothetical protein [Chloroflexota bacterium]MYI04466.1 hypothetical protein [Chloroflexota bacterium]